MTKTLFNNIPFEDKTNVCWRVQDSDENSILFYNLGEGDPTQFQQRVSQAQFLRCFVRGSHDFQKEGLHYLSDSEFFDLREKVVAKKFPLPNTILVGVTGTNGKTTVVDFMRQICNQKNISCMSVGTLGVYVGTRKIDDFSLTTPDYIDLRKVIYENPTKVVLLEVSSHGLVQKRFGSLTFKAMGWTSFSQDHLDFHKTMENYFEAKKLIFNYVDKESDVLIPELQKEIIERLKYKKPTTVPLIKMSQESPFLKIGYNQQNYALAVCLLRKVSLIESELFEVSPPPGRFNVIRYESALIVIDFAHSPGGIESLCSEIKQSFDGYEIVTLFGCGGNRDRSKRPAMAKAASKYSDFLIVTSDNPRDEEPLDIIEDIKPGISVDYVIEEDRKKAIEIGMKRIRGSKMILVIAGKGHEEYIEAKGKRTFFSDEDEVRKIIND